MVQLGKRISKYVMLRLLVSISCQLLSFALWPNSQHVLCQHVLKTGVALYFRQEGLCTSDRRGSVLKIGGALYLGQGGLCA